MRKNLLWRVTACLIPFLAGCALNRNSITAAGTTTSKPAQNPNLIKNGDFDCSLENWLTIGQEKNPFHPDDPGRAVFRIKKGMLEVEIKDQGISIWSVMLYQSIPFEKGATYDVSFDAKSDSETQIISNVAEDVTWTNLSGDKKFRLTHVMSSYSYQFIMSKDGAALFQLCLGMAGTGKIYIDKIVMRKK